jgi:FkbM family methyltransferase
VLFRSNYFGFEPNPDDFKILKYNVKNCENLINCALGDVNSDLTFYTSTEGGDSSLIEPSNWSKRLKVKVIRLDSFIENYNIKNIKLLKIEAEGFEPEIIIGLGEKITTCEYIAIDGGYERGVKCEQTFTTCNNYLCSSGFELIDIYFPAYRALYKKK